MEKGLRWKLTVSLLITIIGLVGLIVGLHLYSLHQVTLKSETVSDPPTIKRCAREKHVY